MSIAEHQTPVIQFAARQQAVLRTLRGMRRGGTLRDIHEQFDAVAVDRFHRETLSRIVQSLVGLGLVTVERVGPVCRYQASPTTDAR